MNRMTTIALHFILTAAPALPALAQPGAPLQAPSQQIQRAAEPVVRCAYEGTGFVALQPCRARPGFDAILLGQDVTRQEFECVLSGVCGTVVGTRLNG